LLDKEKSQWALEQILDLEEAREECEKPLKWCWWSSEMLVSGSYPS